jgi:MoxR-like ATPase
MNIKKIKKLHKALNPKIARFLSGDAGLGKTAFVEAVAKEEGRRCVALRLNEREKGDLLGMPEIVDGVTRFAPFDWWVALEQGPSILFLDEMNRAETDVIQVTMQLLNERCIAGRTLPDDCIIFAAGNGSKYQTISLDQAIINRCAFINFEPTVQEWLDWASEQNIDAVRQYIQEYPNLLDTPEKLVGEADMVVPSRRAWARVGELIAGGIDLDDVYDFTATLIGNDAAAAFAGWYTEYTRIVITPEAIIDGRVTTIKKDELSDFMNIIPSLAARLSELSAEQLEKVVALTHKTSREAFVALCNTCPIGMKMRVAHTPTAKKVLKKMYPSIDISKHQNMGFIEDMERRLNLVRV